jgi:predicted permease
MTAPTLMTADEIRHAIRDLRSRPGFLIIALLTLGIGIGANIAVFSLVNALMLRPLPFGDRSDRIVSIHATHRSQAEDWPDARLSYLDLQDVRRARVLEDAAGFVARNFTLQDGDAERVFGGSVTTNLFPMLGVVPAIGRAFHENDAAPPGLESVVIITHGLWQRRFGGSAAVLGRSMLVNGRSLIVVGVMPPGFAFPERAALYVPLRWETSPRSQRTVSSFGLLQSGQTLSDARQRLDALAADLSRTHPRTHDGWTMRVMAFRELMLDPGDRQLHLTLLVAVGFVLMIGCANLTGLLLARGEARRRDFAVRAALGATRWDLVRSTLVESGVIALLGTSLGGLVAAWALAFVPYAFADGLPYWVDLTVDARVVAFTAVLMIFTTIVLGVVPGIRFSRPDVNTTLKSSSTGSTSAPGIQRMRGALVVVQVALSVALVSAAVLMIRSVIALSSAASGFDEGHVLTFRTYVAGDQFDEVPARAAALASIVAELRRAPGVDDVALTTSIPTDDGGAPIEIVAGGEWIRGRELGGAQVAISPGLFTTLGIDLQGRTFTDTEFADPRADTVVVSRALASRLWPGSSAIDQRLSIVVGDRLEPRRVVGVAGNVVYEEVGEETEQSRLIVYVPYARVASRTMAVMLRASSGPESTLASVRRIARDRFRGMPIYDMRTMQQVRTYTTWEQRVVGDVMTVFALIAIGLAWTGVHGLVAYAVARRTREIGVRIALGARRADVMRMISADIAALAAPGAVLGLVLGALLARLLEGSIYGVDPRDPRVLVGAASAMSVAMFAAAFWPARRATKIEPAIALRAE